MTKQCPCNPKVSFADCCQPYLDGKSQPADPETTMRSRYTAFALGDFAYLKKTWHPDTLPDLSEDEPSNWISLDIVETGIDETGDFGEVEFVAKLIVGDSLEVLHEVSEFEKVGGNWLYHSGEFLDDTGKPKKISMKTPCPCGSGEKFKHCHFRA